MKTRFSSTEPAAPGGSVNVQFAEVVENGVRKIAGHVSISGETLPPAVTGFFISEDGVLDANGTPVSQITVTFTPPSPLDNFFDVMLFRCDDNFGDPLGNWQFCGECLESGTVMQIPVVGVIQWFCAVSKSTGGMVPDPDTPDGPSFKYPRVSVLVDGYTDTNTAEAPEIGVVRSQAQPRTPGFHVTIGVDVPTPAPDNWKTAYQTEIQVTPDGSFATFPADRSIQRVYKWVPENSVEFYTNFPGTYYIRARVYTVQGPGNWGSLSFSTDSLTNLTEDNDLIAAVTPTLVIKNGATANYLGGNEIEVLYTIPELNTGTFYGRSLYIHDSSTLPTATTQETGTGGFLRAGSATLLDLSKSWTTDQWANKDVVIFSEKRGGSPSFDYEGLIYVCKILSNTSTEITFDAPPEQVRRTVGGLTYYVVNRGAGHHFWEKLKFTTPCETDDGIKEGVLEFGGRTRTKRVTIGFAPAYVWIALYNVFGQGKVTATPPSTSILGISSLEIADGAVLTDKIDDSAVTAAKLTDQAKGFNTDIVFAAQDNDTVTWTAGSIRTADGTTYSIDSGNTGNMAGTMYIYFNRTISTTVLQLTTNYVDAAAENSILLCFAKKTAASNQYAFFVPAIGVFGINETVIGPNSISTGKIQANAITANEIAANAITAGKISAGAIDGMTITGALLRTAASGSRIEMDVDGFRAYNGSTLITSIPITSGNIGQVYTSNVQSINTALQLNEYTGNSQILLVSDRVEIATNGATIRAHISSTAFNVRNCPLQVNGTTVVNTSAQHVGDGSLLTSLNADNLASGTVPSGRISGTYSNNLVFSGSIEVQGGLNVSGGGATIVSANLTFSNGYGIVVSSTYVALHTTNGVESAHQGTVVSRFSTNNGSQIYLSGSLRTLTVYSADLDGNGVKNYVTY